MITASSYGVIGDGLADDTAALQSFLTALATARGLGVLPAGNYRTTAPVVLDGDDVRLVGDGCGATRIITDGGGGLVLGNGVTCRRNVSVADLAIMSPAYRANGAGLKLDYVHNCFAERVRVTGQWVGVEIVRGYQVHVNGCWVTDITPTTGTGVLIHGEGNDQYVRDVFVYGGSGTQPLAGLRVRRTGGVWLDNVGLLCCGDGLVIDPAGGDTVEHLFSSRCAADTCTRSGYLIQPASGATVRRLKFMGDWTCTCGGSGVLLQGGADIRFIGHTAVNNQVHGMHANVCDDLLIDGASVAGNGGAGSPAYHGIVLGPVNGARIIANRSGAFGGFSNIQGYGLYMASAAAQAIIIDGNDFRGNLSGAMATAGSPKVGLNWP